MKLVYRWKKTLPEKGR